MRRGGLARTIVGHAQSEKTRDTALRLGLVELGLRQRRGGRARCRSRHPVRAGRRMRRHRRARSRPRLRAGAILTDVGSVKGAVVRDVGPSRAEGRALHPRPSDRRHRALGARVRLRRAVRRPLVHPDAAGGRRSGRGRQADGVLAGAAARTSRSWTRSTTTWCSPSPATCRTSSPTTSSTRRGTWSSVTDTEVIKFSAGGFRDFTRIAASDPVMWRDVFLNNKEAVLEMLGRFTEDLTALQRAIRFGDGDTLFKLFVEARAVRRGIIEAGQDTAGARLRPPAGGERRSPPGKQPCSMTEAGARSVGVRLRLADVAAGICLRGGAARAPHRLPALLLHLLGASSRHARAAGHGAGPRPRRRLRGDRLSRGGGERGRDHRAICARASRSTASIARRTCRWS